MWTPAAPDCPHAATPRSATKSGAVPVRRRRRLREALGLAGLAYLGLSLLAAPGCHLIFPYRTACPRYKCDTPYYETVPTHQPIDVAIVKSVDPNCVKWHPPRTAAAPDAGFAVAQRLYCEPTANWVAKDIGFDALKGAGWITARQKDADALCLDPYLTFVARTRPGAVYVAYDSRVSTQPGWLPGRPETQTGSVGSPPAYLTITDSTAAKERQLYVWRWTRPPLEERDVAGVVTGYRYEIPSNLCGMPKWPPQFLLSQAAMFIVFVDPEADRTVTPTLGPQRGTKGYENVDDRDPCPDMAALEATAMDSCVAALQREGNEGKYLCAKPSPPVAWCTPQGFTAATGSLRQALGHPPVDLRYPISSRIEFDPAQFPSNATISIAGTLYTSNAHGGIDFEYTLAPGATMLDLRLDSLLLQVDPVTSKAGEFTDIVVALSAPARATCQDTAPPFRQPCAKYRIGPGELVGTVTARHGDGTLVVIAKNALAADIGIDHATRTFAISKLMLQGTIKINDQDTEFVVGPTLTGRFVNFAPQASGAESGKGAECGRGRLPGAGAGAPVFIRGNTTPIALDASASFEIYDDPLPVTATSYRWYEDHGLVTERFLGTGKRHTIPAYGLGYGVHQMTLALRDDFGVVGTDTFNVEVRDAVPPKLLIPADVIVVLPANASSITLDLGEAQADDECSPDVVVGNDAPVGNAFGLGLTKVTWRADDGRGNVTEKVQDVWVGQLLGIDMVGTGIARLKAGASKARSATRECDAEIRCELGIRSLARAALDLAAAAATVPVEEVKRAGIVARLQRAGEALASADRALTRAQGVAVEARAVLRSRAGAELERAEAILMEAADLLR